MALGFLNRVGFRASSSGTGSFVVASALTGMQVPEDAAGPAVVNGATYNYFAESDDKTQWEYGKGVYTTGDDTLTRATVLDNSSGGTTALAFSAAPKVLMGGPLAGDMPGLELLGYFDLAVDGPLAEIELDADLTEFAYIEIVADGLRHDTTNLEAVSADYIVGAVGLRNAGDAELFGEEDLAYIFSYVSNNTTAVLSEITYNGITTLFTRSHFSAFSHTVKTNRKFDDNVEVAPDTAGEISDQDPGFADDGPAVTLYLRGTFWDNSLSAYGANQNFIAGKVWFYGRRL